jgi:hypothetical protein
MSHDILKLDEWGGGAIASRLQGLACIPCKMCKVTAGRCQRPDGIRPWSERQGSRRRGGLSCPPTRGEESLRRRTRPHVALETTDHFKVSTLSFPSIISEAEK